MKGLKAILVLSGLGVIGYAFYRYYSKQINFLADIQYQITGLQIVTLTADNVSIDVTSKIYNASNVEATVTEMYLDLLINGIKVGNVSEAKNILISPMASSNVTFRFSFNPKLIIGNLVSLLTLSVGSKDVLIDAKGYVKVKSGFIETVVPFQYHNDLKTLLKNNGMGGASNFFTKTLTNGSITIVAAQKVMKVSILTRQGSVSFIGDAVFDGMAADLVTLQNGQGITITARGTGLPIDNFTITAGTTGDIADIILSY